MYTRALTATAAFASASLLLAGCSPSEQPAQPEIAAVATATSATSATAAAEDAALVFDNAVIRAKEAGDANTMTAIFGTLRNTTDEDITVTGFTSTLGDARYEVHKTENGTMSPVDNGLTIPAGESVELAPGGYHLMVLDYTDEIAAGDSVDLTLETSAGDIEVPGVEVRTLIPGEENYGEDGEMVGHSMHEGHEGHEGH
ncbi:copper chaperone PCu(A)C [Corynebacterium sanguinis]|uniref:copper chaperone PCu(A)C n=1 Tax=Corynebacterium sanguinis TaxID=2594913 RepID=UPI00223C2055|nr:copper chaperone PCu(A)C [Corynebacterium sanguinis]MCT1411062.1 copper chaperone PCu(A)C [Corynebacterium sanguinis]MCT1444053.1 copper chaperone PCu(A)C [Corynebacterium sanguinis]MCT1492297.1 copper chaperone PCu(A)C [Corynebacterium sanguinis]MCT1695104.1 copper chaperone PCu(A)C [Corynebacterium sanguinis]MCT1714195.1 copper chaperone PCu(A)C [Corynebacterium sanguinis]